MTFPNSSLDLEPILTRIKLILETLKSLNELVEITPELQEGEKQQIIREFRVKLINALVKKARDINQNTSGIH